MTVEALRESIVVADRDLWLVRAVNRLRPILQEYGLRVPKYVTVKAGPTLPSSVSSMRRLGECWPSWTRADGLPGIVVDDAVTDEMTILAVLVHELVHASDDCRSGHGSWFRAWAGAVGLDGPLPHTCAGPLLRRQLQPIARGLGRYPAAEHGYCLSRSGSFLS